MDSISRRVKKVMDANTPVRNPDKLEKQQNYYKRLSENGVAQKQTYNLKPLSSI